MNAKPLCHPKQSRPDDLSSEGVAPLDRGMPDHHQRLEVSPLAPITLLYLEAEVDRRAV